MQLMRIYTLKCYLGGDLKIIVFMKFNFGIPYLEIKNYLGYQDSFRLYQKLNLKKLTIERSILSMKWNEMERYGNSIGRIEFEKHGVR